MITVWACPECGRSFRREGQRHACGLGSRATLLRGKPPGLVTLYHSLEEPGRDVRRPAAFTPFFTKLQGAFSDIEITVEQTIAEGEWVASRWIARMTHRGDQLGVPATGRRVEVSGMSMGRFHGDKMVEGWNNWDQMALMEQIQATPRSVQLLP
jgi:predicted ester cyclase